MILHYSANTMFHWSKLLQDIGLTIEINILDDLQVSIICHANSTVQRATINPFHVDPGIFWLIGSNRRILNIHFSWKDISFKYQNVQFKTNGCKSALVIKVNLTSFTDPYIYIIYIYIYLYEIRYCLTIPSESSSSMAMSLPLLSLVFTTCVPTHMPKVLASMVWPRSKASGFPSTLREERMVIIVRFSCGYPIELRENKLTWYS